MDAALREAFNASWTPELFRRVRTELVRRIGHDIPFPVAETPLFLPADTWERIQQVSEEVLELLMDPEFIAGQAEAVPPACWGPNIGKLPQCAQVDLAIVREEDGSLGAKVVELQGFPSLYGYQIMLADVWATALVGFPGLPGRWRLFFGNRNRYEALALLRETLLGEHDPLEVVLLDVEPTHQKTAPDFTVTYQWFGIEPVCVSDIRRDGPRLYRVRQGKTIPVRRIYQRIVWDELVRRGFRLPFDLRDDIEVEWVPHPAWFFMWSKYSLLTLDHPAVPWTRRIAEIDELPEDLSGYVLKPLYSFAGLGVEVGPTEAQIAAIPKPERNLWVLQEFVPYEPAVRTPGGDGVKAEVRMMFVRPDSHERPTLLVNLVRLSRGKMMGVDHNKNVPWTGSSVAIRPF